MRKSSGTWLLAPLNSLGLIGSGIGCMALLVVLLIGLSLSLFASLFVSVGGTHQAVGNSAIITQTARTMAAQLQDCREMTTPQARENSCGGAFPRYAALTPAFPPSLLQWGRSHCGASCAAWESGNFQCVSFVLAAYALAHPLDFSGNGNQFWGLYTTSAARAKGYQTVATGTGLPLAPGDIMAWSGGAFGHVSIVLSWQAPSADTPGKIAFASANTWKPIEELPLLPNLQVDTKILDHEGGVFRRVDEWGACLPRELSLGAPQHPLA